MYIKYRKFINMFLLPENFYEHLKRQELKTIIHMLIIISDKEILVIQKKQAIPYR
jgi:hypothetical protein